MKINNIVIGSIFVLGLSLLSTPAYAEEVSEEAPIVEESPAPEPSPEPTPEPAPETEPEPTPEPEPSYTPPPEASEGVGGWAVVNPETGKVHGVIVGTIATYNSRGGKISKEYMGCHKDCVLRFQTQATSDGNVAGFHGTDSDNSVTWNSNENNFSVKSQSETESFEATLEPSLTARDEAGMDLNAGLVDIKTKQITEENVEIKQTQEDYLDEEIETDIFFPEWGTDGKLFNYGSELQAKESIESDVDNELVLESYTVEQEATEELVINEANVFVKTVRIWTNGVVEFFASIF